MYNPWVLAFMPVPPMNAARSGHSATLVALSTGGPDTSVLVAGGHGAVGPLASAEIYTWDRGPLDWGYPPSTWKPTGPMSTPRSGHSAVRLPSGKVLVIGGHGAVGPLASAEIFDHLTNTWAAAAPMQNARAGHAAALLKSGKVLVTGGDDGSGPLASTEIFDPLTNTWAAALAMSDARVEPTATLLPNGEVLVAGGRGVSGALASAEIYDPATGTWAAAAPMQSARARHQAELFTIGLVLVAGGDGGSGPLASAEIYDSATDAWAAAAPLGAARESFRLLRFEQTEIMAVGGEGGGGALASAEQYTPPAPLAPGAHCAFDNECQSGVCAGNTCCSGPCPHGCDPDWNVTDSYCDASGACQISNTFTIHHYDCDPCGIDGSDTHFAPAKCFHGQFLCRIAANGTSCWPNLPVAPSGTCQDGYCVVPPLPAGAICHWDENCQSGTCVWDPPSFSGICCDKACNGPCETCDLQAGASATGICTPISGKPCDDGDLCTQADTCQNGACTAGSPVACSPLDVCHDAGTCVPQTGVCSSPPKPNGTPCPGGTCQAGTCVAAPDGGSGGAGGAATTSSSQSGTGGAGGASGTSSSQSGTGGAAAEGDPNRGGGGCAVHAARPPSTGAIPCLERLAPWLVLVLAARRRRSAAMGARCGAVDCGESGARVEMAPRRSGRCAPGGIALHDHHDHACRFRPALPRFLDAADRARIRRLCVVYAATCATNDGTGRHYRTRPESSTNSYRHARWEQRLDPVNPMGVKRLRR
jgi:hypothetical protein